MDSTRDLRSRPEAFLSRGLAAGAGLLVAGLATAGALLGSGCETREEVVLHRSGCEVCHQPLDAEGTPTGLEEAHPWYALSCVDCHGGNDRVCDGTIIETPNGPACDSEWIYDKERAHVGPGDGPSYLRNLSAGVLDEVDPDYLRFINPGDYRVADQTCGGGASGGPCHAEVVAVAKNSTMAHTSGEITVARYRASKQDDPRGQFGAVALTDDAKDPNDACGVAQLDVFDPPPIDVDSTDPADEPSVANVQDQYMVKSCFRCHLGDFGENRFRGDFRSSGCTGCHMTYADDGLSQTADETISKNEVPHPVTHELTSSPPNDQCTHCHYRGGRLGISMQGYRESPGPGLTPPNVESLGETLHGHDASYYLVDEDTTNDFDETPPDVHFEAGMHCVDCHALSDVHGDGHLYADTQCAVSTGCTDCHGSVRKRALPGSNNPNLFERDGDIYLLTRVTNLELRVPQTLDSVTPGMPGYTKFAEEAMGVDENGFSHTDELECYTCHAAWLPSCYGCHVEVDLTQPANYHTTGAETAGKPTGTRRWIQLNDLVLMRNTQGMIAPSMPSERFFMTIVALDEEATEAEGETVTKVLTQSSPRVFTREDGSTMAGFGQRAFNPHTTRRRSAFMACDRCHSVGDPAAPDNAVLLDITYGFGSERFPELACDVSNVELTCDPETDFTTYQLDAIQTREGEPLVVVGHPDPIESRPLTLDEIDRMRNVVVPDDPVISTPIPGDALTNPDWPFAQNP